MKRRIWKRSICILSLLLCLTLCLSACSGPSGTFNSLDANPAAAKSAGGDGPADGKPELNDGAAAFSGGPLISVDGKSAAGAAGDDGSAIVKDKAHEPEASAAPAGTGAEPESPEEEADRKTPEIPQVPAQELLLTAAEWNDNQNWPFFTNLVNSGKISFPAFGIDPCQRLEVLVTDAAGAPLPNESLSLLDAENKLLWSARTDKRGCAYLFYQQGQSPERVVCGQSESPVSAQSDSGAQGGGTMRPLDLIRMTVEPSASAVTELQIMFIVDTTGSMSDELAYLQKDFSAIAQRVGGAGVQYAVSFYRDEGDDYVTRHHDFTSDVAQVQASLNAEYADGGGDEPEAVAQVLTECITQRSDWAENASKLAFLIFDAPPHAGTEQALVAAVQAAAEKGIRLIPVVASNAQRETELFGRAVAICTNATYVFLTDDSGVGDSHLEPIVGSYTVEQLQDLIVRLIEQYR